MSREGRKEVGPRLAASFYLNSAPLIWSFIHGEKSETAELVTDAAPARCADMLERGEVEAALVPTIDYQRMRDVLLVPGVCVASRERVRSVVLVTRGAEFKEVRSVALDTTSRTSATLVRILFREFYGREPEWKRAAPDLPAMLREADAALLIGDPAMTFRRENLRVYDLASLWREQTGLGFVFAMWMARASSAERVRAVDFAGARDEGVRRAAEIAASYSPALGLPQSELCDYLLENISYKLTEELGAGLDLFYKLAHKHDLLSALRPLKMLS